MHIIGSSRNATKMVLKPLTPPTLNVILVIQINRGDKMKIISKIMKVGGSYAVIIPPTVMEEMKLLKRDLVLIQYDENKMDIIKLNDIINKRDKG